MVNSKQALFKVNKQPPSSGQPPQAYSTVINCQKPRGKRALGAREVKTHQVRLARIPGIEPDRKRKMAEDGESGSQRAGTSGLQQTAANSFSNAVARHGSRAGFYVVPSRRHVAPPKFRRGKVVGQEIDLDTWFTILSFSNPAQLLEMRTKIASCYRFLRDNPRLWKHSRDYYYHGNLPEPPSLELTEFQYAHLRHGHGCMSCGTPSTRKTYWAFLRRWCKHCLNSKLMKESDALMLLFKDASNEEIMNLRKILPSGIIDSWGNFVGVGPAETHSLKTVYLISDVKTLFGNFEGGNTPYQMEVVNARLTFAKAMQEWEDKSRQTKSFDYHQKKKARKVYFTEKASQLVPPITLHEMESCQAFRRAIAIPKEPNMTSWHQLKPKLEKEAANLRAGGHVLASQLGFPISGSSTPSSNPQARGGLPNSQLGYSVPGSSASHMNFY
ncbi:hypothetical protein P280DRAFT_436439 [Massarina eburnea CBS 473.64]|uniref:F-box domain-containing protein n=1 Tax=Massarina eburnea CBS 473.64 TaxID=1395130 RepID=A0A6A6RL63_9PLEO|nr:hypothetical protein P280DRAFT_436439 [Massarina eburnea CBS 473.64]